MVHLRHDELTWQELEDEIIVLDLRASQYFVVNGSGTRLWRLLAAEPRTTEQLATELVRVYDLPRATAIAHARSFVDDLDDRGLIDS